MRETTEGPVPIIEDFVDPEIMSAITGIASPDRLYIEWMNILVRGGISNFKDFRIGYKMMKLIIPFFKGIGYDQAITNVLAPYPRTKLQLKENPQQRGKLRWWENEREGIIMSREDYESFPWPSANKINIFFLKLAALRLPKGMRFQIFIVGIFEELKNLMGFDQMFIKSIEEPGLLGDIMEQVTVLLEVVIDKAASHPATGTIFYNDDLAFKTGTFLSPAWLREFYLPRLKRLADVCHKHGKPFIFHSCGRIEAIMEDLIEVVGIDARHSFQDSIVSVEEFYKKYGDRIAVLGGLDVDLLARGTPEQVRARTRQILEVCAPGGGYCMGSGNSVANYCRIENYYAMLDETRKWNQEHGWM